MTNPNSSTQATETTICVGDIVIGGDIDEDRESGKVLDVDGDRVLVQWAQEGFRTWTDVSGVALDPDAVCSTHGCARHRCDASH
jgi:hypothetical protein